MKNILILGGSGFIGRNIIEALDDGDYNIFVMTRKKDFDQSIKNPMIHVVEGGLNDIDVLKEVILDFRIEIILHLASNLIPSSDKDEFDDEMQEIILPTLDILNYVSEKNLKVIYFSSGGTVYGKANEQKIRENCELEPINYYGYSKVIIENHIKLLNRLGNLRYIILRPSNVYGKYQRSESKQGFISVALKKIMCDQVIEIWGDGNTVRDYIDVSDVSVAVKSIIKENIENKVFNLGCGEGFSLHQVVKFLEKYSHRTAALEYKDRRAVDVDKMVLDVSALKSSIKFEPKPLDVGIKHFVKHLLQAKPDEK